MADKAKYNLAAMRERVMEKSFDIELSDGSTVSMPPPELWPIGDEQDGATVLQRALGDEQWERFTADGGTVGLLDQMVREHQAASAGESSASSSS